MLRARVFSEKLEIEDSQSQKRNQTTCVVVEKECTSGPKEWVGDPQGCVSQDSPDQRGWANLWNPKPRKAEGRSGGCGPQDSPKRRWFDPQHQKLVAEAEVAVGGWVGIVCERKRKNRGVNDVYPAYSEKYHTRIHALYEMFLGTSEVNP